MGLVSGNLTFISRSAPSRVHRVHNALARTNGGDPCHSHPVRRAGTLFGHVASNRFRGNTVILHTGVSVTSSGVGVHSPVVCHVVGTARRHANSG